jgi:hypothetical protein
VLLGAPLAIKRSNNRFCRSGDLMMQSSVKPPRRILLRTVAVLIAMVAAIPR